MPRVVRLQGAASPRREEASQRRQVHGPGAEPAAELEEQHVAQEDAQVAGDAGGRQVDASLAGEEAGGEQHQILGDGEAHAPQPE